MSSSLNGWGLGGLWLQNVRGTIRSSGVFRVRDTTQNCRFKDIRLCQAVSAKNVGCSSFGLSILSRAERAQVQGFGVEDILSRSSQG